MKDNNCVVTNKTKGKLPSLPFSDMKSAVLGKSYELSVVFVSQSVIRKLNATHRGKNTATDILSFPLSRKEGEIFLNCTEAKKEARKFGRTFENFIGFLFIHGLVHLEGFDHGSRMEAQEIKFRKKFGM
ncbi:MAG: rRNA maturation RNase YbeY [Candidatus Taylorbacteria bacterium]|nr:rRNA maturation RNase YbeY [Candidatus Taylorbacteria bacterium]